MLQTCGAQPEIRIYAIILPFKVLLVLARIVHKVFEEHNGLVGLKSAVIPCVLCVHTQVLPL
jgi:metal-dependent HD superfamily phosphatase/phosphodiesterase